MFVLNHKYHITKFVKKVVLGIIAIVVAGCVFYFLKSGKNEVVEQCILLCKKALEQGVNLSNGPCLSDENPEWKFILLKLLLPASS